ncbi:GNAT family N-acetyltransferase [Kineococcus sp. SYSU DK005]|uniref:GNAT family N-acetyltransferase n=1 Tax=Kineococcus sp. SYSU DK005 TaxID=3383126 RepID=UPI003D7E6ADA
MSPAPGAAPAAVLRPARPQDAGELLTVQRAAFVAEAQRYGDPMLPPLREDLAAVAAAIADPDVVVLVALVPRPGGGERLVGAVRLRVDGERGHVGRLCVAPDQQGRGTGSALLAAVEAAAPPGVRTFALFTGAGSTATVARYERAGYVRTGAGADDRGVALVHLAKTRPAGA